MFNGVSTERKSQAVMSAQAQIWNGHFAILGLVALPWTEYIKGCPQGMSSHLVDPQPKDSSTASPQSTTPIPPRPPAPKKVSTKFGDVFAFSGPAPETINGRLAMLGFVSAIGVEIASGRDLFSQLASGGVPLFVGSAVVLTLASLIPMFSGVSTESRSQAIMSARAEMWNGRFAMLGLVALAFTEYLKGGPLIS